MTQAYSDKTREAEPFALPDVEVFYRSELDVRWLNRWAIEARRAEVGWYWWSCFPGCLPDGEASGPFDTEAEALADAQDIN